MTRCEHGRRLTEMCEPCWLEDEGDEPWDDPEKLDYVAHLPCLLAKTDGEHCSGRVTVHHQREYGGRRDDRWTLPLCQFGHHQEGPRSYHVLGREQFVALHGIEPMVEARRIHRDYLEMAA